MHQLIIGSRGSKLALWQSGQARARLRLIDPEIEIQIEIIKTEGDVRTDPLTVIGGKGVFTKELEEALLDHRIDVAVHSLKDLPTLVPEGLVITAICEREDPRDALVLHRELNSNEASLHRLPLRAVVGTSSQRRIAQLKALRDDVVVKDLRGNVDTRLRKLDEGHYDALILACAGLRRLSLADRISAAIPVSDMLPAVGQGAVAIETRLEDQFTNQRVAKLNHEQTAIECMAERALLRSLGGGCQFPIAAHAIVYYDELKLDALVARPDGSQILRESVHGSVEEAEKIGNNLATMLLDRGAAALIAGQ
ncbi:MAG: hydroxymethylbilane synthase [Pyrinomonadaceae bacterium]